MLSSEESSIHQPAREQHFLSEETGSRTGYTSSFNNGFNFQTVHPMFSSTSFRSVKTGSFCESVLTIILFPVARDCFSFNTNVVPSVKTWHDFFFTDDLLNKRRANSVLKTIKGFR